MATNETVIPAIKSNLKVEASTQNGRINEEAMAVADFMKYSQRH
jgi:hypothetical protein